MQLVTPWRLLNSGVVLALGAYKATAEYRGQTAVTTTLDWIVGMLWVLIAYWASFYESRARSSFGRWFFAGDPSVALAILVLVLVFCGIFVGAFINPEDPWGIKTACVALVFVACAVFLHGIVFVVFSGLTKLDVLVMHRKLPHQQASSTAMKVQEQVEELNRETAKNRYVSIRVQVDTTEQLGASSGRPRRSVRLGHSAARNED
ncbi:hypothetical protein B0H19DRAFT_1323320 [Mycena capillaripes]|nr:hypothetical protein B0H19DRAFT_1323320 [Mycena capillaripes]